MSHALEDDILATIISPVVVGQIIDKDDGTREIVEGDGIVGETPTLRPGEVFRYHSQHVAGGPLRASGAFHGKDASGAPLHVRIPEFAMDPGAA